jgi:hypothetical protein
MSRTDTHVFQGSVLPAVHSELETYSDDLDPLPVLVFSTEVGPMPGVVVVHPGSYPI